MPQVNKNLFNVQVVLSRYADIKILHVNNVVEQFVELLIGELIEMANMLNWRKTAINLLITDKISKFLTKRMTTVLIVAKILALRTVVSFISFPLLVVELESTAAAVFLLKISIFLDFQSILHFLFTSQVL